MFPEDDIVILFLLFKCLYGQQGFCSFGIFLMCKKVL